MEVKGLSTKKRRLKELNILAHNTLKCMQYVLPKLEQILTIYTLT